MKYHVISSFVTYGSFCVSARAIKKNKNTIVRNSFSAVQPATLPTHRKTYSCAFCELRKHFFRCFNMKEHH